MFHTGKTCIEREVQNLPEPLAVKAASLESMAFKQASLSSPPSPNFPTSNMIKKAVRETTGGTFKKSSGQVIDIIDVPPTGVDTGVENIIEKLAEAKESILISSYIFDEKSEVGKKLLSALRKKQDQIPDFKIFITTNKFLPSARTDFLHALKKVGLKACVAIAPKRFSRGSIHSKLYIIDSKLAYTGGDNVDNPIESDILIGLTGDVVKKLFYEFDKDFHYGDIYILRDEAAPPTNPEQELLSLAPDDLAYPLAEDPERASISIIGKEPSLSWKGNHTNNIANKAIKTMIALAEEKISIMTPHSNDMEIWESLKDAAEKGVQVKIILPKNYSNLASFLDRATNYAIVSYVEKLPPEVRENFDIRWYADKEGELKDNHSKFLAIDGHSTYIGSCNFDNQSFSFSRELGVLIESEKLTKKLSNIVFESKWQTSIPAELPWHYSFLPTPPATTMGRIQRLLLPPLLLVDLVKDYTLGVKDHFGRMRPPKGLKK